MSINGDAASASGREGLWNHWNDKLRLLDAIDAMREPAQPTQLVVKTMERRDSDSNDVDVLKEKLHVYEQTCAMLEREVQVLEQQTLAALAEAGRLRRELDRSQARRNNSDRFLDYAEKDSIRKIIDDSDNERRLLLDALENSEAELARMVKTLDVVVRKLQVA